MDYQANRLITKKRRSSQQKHANGNKFAYHNYDFFMNKIISKPTAKPLYPKHNQSHEIKYNPTVTKTSISISFF